MAEIADADLPVFPFRVNWKTGISERLEWKTDVLRDLVGNEQRRGLRLTPRRDFEVTLTVWDQERAFLDLWLHRMVGDELLFPLWHDSTRSTQEAAGGQKTIWVDTRGLEFGIGSYGLLRGLTAISWERFQIAEVHDDRIVTVANLANAWPKGTRVEPLIRGRLSDQSRTNLASSRASETQAAFETTRAQPYDAGVDTADQYLGLPVLTAQPNRTDGLDVQHEWAFFDSDSDTGRRFRKSETDRAMVAQKHSWFLRGRTAKSEFRSLLYRLMGSLKPVWLPTFNEDLVLAQDAAAAATSIYVKEIGFAYTGGPSSGREHIMIETTHGRLYRRVTGTAVAPAGQERLVLSAALPTGLQRQNVRRISWMDTARLQNDRIEFDHINAADGLSKVASIFQTFRNERTAPAVLSAPIPAAIMDDEPCGTMRTVHNYTFVIKGLPIMTDEDTITPPANPTYGIGNLQGNLKFAADALGSNPFEISTNPRSVFREAVGAWIEVHGGRFSYIWEPSNEGGSLHIDMAEDGDTLSFSSQIEFFGNEDRGFDPAASCELFVNGVRSQAWQDNSHLWSINNRTNQHYGTTDGWFGRYFRFYGVGE